MTAMQRFFVKVNYAEAYVGYSFGSQSLSFDMPSVFVWAIVTGVWYSNTPRRGLD